jgi:hypothetical protein
MKVAREKRLGRSNSLDVYKPCLTAAYFGFHFCFTIRKILSSSNQSIEPMQAEMITQASNKPGINLSTPTLKYTFPQALFHSPRWQVAIARFKEQVGLVGFEQATHEDCLSVTILKL